MITGAPKHSVMVKVGYGNETKMIPLGDIEIDGIPLKDVLLEKDNKIAMLNERYNKEVSIYNENVKAYKLSVDAMQEKVDRLQKETLVQLEASKEVIKGLITR